MQCVVCGWRYDFVSEVCVCVCVCVHVYFSMRGVDFWPSRDKVVDGTNELEEISEILFPKTI